MSFLALKTRLLRKLCQVTSWGQTIHPGKNQNGQQRSTKQLPDLVATNRCCRGHWLARRKHNTIFHLSDQASLSNNWFWGKLFQNCTGWWKAVELEAILVTWGLRHDAVRSKRGWAEVTERPGAGAEVAGKEGAARLSRRGSEKLAGGSGCELRFLEGGHGRGKGRERKPS